VVEAIDVGVWDRGVRVWSCRVVVNEGENWGEVAEVVALAVKAALDRVWSEDGRISLPVGLVGSLR
jgi:hypothetical protein